MKMLYPVLLFLSTVLLAADAPKEDAAKKEREKLAGTWKVLSAERDGQPDSVSKSAVVSIAADGKLRVRFQDGVESGGTYQIDPNKTPKAIDYTLDSGPNKGKQLTGIYALEGDRLKLCGSDPGKPRPKEFVTKTDSGHLLFVLAREKAQTAKSPPSPPPPPVFADKNLEAAVRGVLQHTSGELSETNLANIYFLEAPNKNITNLKGLEKCKNLALLKLSNNQIVDLAPLKELTNLQSLDLAGNQIADLTPLAGLNKLQYLELSHNHISNVAPLSGLTSLSSLYLTGNQLRDLTPLGNLTKLASLSLGNNQIQDISVLAKLTGVSTLELKDNQIADVAPLTKLHELSLVLLERNKIADISALVAAAKGDYEGAKRFAPYLRLYISGNPLSDAGRTSQLATLRAYGVRIEN